MQFNLIPAFFIFLGSYFPLAIILTIQDINDSSLKAGFCSELQDCIFPSLSHPILASISLALTLICLFLTQITLARLKLKLTVDVIESKPIPAELINYTIPYVVSFMGVDFSSIGKLLGLLTFLFLLFLISYKANQIVMNPMLILLGWNLYDIKARVSNQERTVRMLSKKPITPGKYYYHDVQGIYISNGEEK